MKKISRFPSVRQMIVESALDSLNEDWEGRSSAERKARSVDGLGKNPFEGKRRSFLNQLDFDRIRNRALGGDEDDMFREPKGVNPNRKFRESDAKDWTYFLHDLQLMRTKLEPIYSKAMDLLGKYEDRKFNVGPMRDRIKRNVVSKGISQRYNDAEKVLKELVGAISYLNDFLNIPYQFDGPPEADMRIYSP